MNNDLIETKFVCDVCNYCTNKQRDWHRHISSLKHLKSSGDIETSEPENSYTCSNCLRSYKSKNGYWCHKKKCQITEAVASVCEPASTDTDMSLVKTMINMMTHHNNNMQQIFMEQTKTVTTLMDKLASSGNTTMTNSCNTINQTNNQTFNLQFFLNETCKHAMNLNDFIDQIEITMEDLEDMRRLGYSDGVSNILVKNLDRVAVSDRPVHSNDVKRELFYIRNNNKWIRETEDYQYLIKAIKCIVKKNMSQLIKWRELNPEFNDPTSKTCEQHHQMIVNMFNGSDEEAQRNYKKIIRTVANKTPIPKA
jgi:hypothetical protein